MPPTRPRYEEDVARETPVPRRPSTLRTTPVTGAADVEARIELHLSQCRRRGSVMALLAICLDTVQCAGGPAPVALEQLVRQELSNRIGNGVRGSDDILRESERDTVVVMPGADIAVAERVRQRLERVLGGDYRVAGELLHVTVRIGTAAHPAHGARATELLRRASGRR